MLQAAGLKAIAVGNVGTPILDALRDPVDYDVFAVELSSFQLHWSHSVSPVASVCLNVAEDHVDWHGSYASYLADKAKVYENTQKACIYNAEQIETERMVEDADVVEGCRAVAFTTVTPAVSMLGVVEGLLVDRAFIAERKDSAAELASVSDLGPVAPRHMVANALAAAALVRAYGVEPAAVREGPAELPARGTTASSSSPATTEFSGSMTPRPPTRMPPPPRSPRSRDVVWIAGGLSKGVNYEPLIQDHAAAAQGRGADRGGLQRSALRAAATRARCPGDRRREGRN